jgi:hypothetical protein
LKQSSAGVSPVIKEGKMSKIKVNTEVRTLLAELDDAFIQYGATIEKIAEQIGNEIDNIAEKKFIQDIIIGKAWMLVKAATGKKDVIETYRSNK